MFILYLCLTIFLVPILIVIILVQIVQKYPSVLVLNVSRIYLKKEMQYHPFVGDEKLYQPFNQQSIPFVPLLPPLQKKQSKTKNDILCIYLFIKSIWWKFKTKSCHQVVHSIFKHHLCFQLKSLLACMIKVSCFL